MTVDGLPGKERSMLNSWDPKLCLPVQILTFEEYVNSHCVFVSIYLISCFLNTHYLSWPLPLKWVSNNTWGEAFGLPGDSDSKESACSAEDWIRSLSREDPLEKGMATHFSILAWRIPWTEELGKLQSMGSQRVGLDWATNIFTFS